MPVIRIDDHRPTWVYRLYCEHGGLLYVGITSNVRERLKEHRRTKQWWPEVARVLAYQFPTRHAARRAELAAITYDQPLYNIDGVVPNRQYDANRWANEFDTARLTRWTRDFRTIDRQAAAE